MSRPKKLAKSNKSISRKFFLTKFHFLLFQKWPKINFWTRKKFKYYQKCNFTKIVFIYLVSRVFFCLDFFKFCGPLWLIRKITHRLLFQSPYLHNSFNSGINMSTEGISNGPKEVAIDLIAGSLGAIASVYVGQPMDTLKVKMQTFPHLYPSVGKCLR